ncbi:MAG: hypothetical protein FJW39_12105 [Acidobacteria bacterium]|nr:hypothetical protein [Acidobacteriota bacterium]
MSTCRVALLFLLASGLEAERPTLGPAPLAPEGGDAEYRAKAAGIRAAIGGWHDTQNRDLVRTTYLSEIVGTRSLAMGWNGAVAGCNAGTTDQTYRDAVIRRVNWFRSMAGVPGSVGLDLALNAKSQPAALMMSAQRALSHTPPSSWGCYSAAGAEAAGSSNLCLAWGSSADTGCIEGYMEDPGSNNSPVGHRRWILYPQTEFMGTGDVPQTGSYPSGNPFTNALWVVPSNYFAPRPSTRDEFVSWPPRGYLPYEMVPPRWSFSYPSANFSTATVTMTRGGAAVPVQLEPIQQGYGENAIVWIADGLDPSNGSWPRPSSDQTITVTIGGVAVGGSTRSFTYNVIIIDPATGGSSLPSTPGGPSPASGANGVSTNMSLSWAASTGAQTYDVHFGTAASPPLITNTAGTSYAPAALANSTTYYWRIVAKNATGSSSSAVWSFTTAAAGVPSPGTPVLTSPTNGGTAAATGLSLAWGAAANAAAYDVYFGTASNPPLLQGNVTSTSHALSALTAATQYFWRVVAKNASGTAASAIWSFTTTAPAGTAPTITAPPAGAALITRGVTFQWQALPAAGGFEIVIRNSSNSIVFTGQISGGTSTEALISLPVGSFTFSIRSCGNGWGDANCGPYSQRQFTIQVSAPSSSPSITAPAQGAVLTSSTTAFSWSAVGGAEYYEVVLDNIAAGQTDLTTGVPAPATSVAHSMRGSTQYRLRVRACTAACGPWSAAVTFAANLAPAPASAPVITSTQLLNSLLHLTWSAVAGADLYDIAVIQPGAGPGGGALTVASKRVAGTTNSITVPAGDAFVLVTGCNGNGCGPQSAASQVNSPGPNQHGPTLASPVSGTAVNGPVVVFTWPRAPGDNGSNTVYRLYVQDQARQAAALDVWTSQNYYAAYLKAEGTRYDALVVYSPDTGNAVQGPASAFLVWGSSARAPSMTQPAHNSAVAQGNVPLAWSPVPGATLYEYYVAGGGQNPALRGVTPDLTVRVPLRAVNGAATAYSGIVRACPAGASCSPGSETGWGPWSATEGGGTAFQVLP